MELIWSRVKIKLAGVLLLEVLVLGGMADSLGGYLNYAICHKQQYERLIENPRK